MIKLPILSKLKESILQLEDNIEAAKKVILKKPERVQYVERIESYESMVLKQKKLTLELEQLLSDKNTKQDDVTRVVNLINGLSEMIKDDARLLLRELSRGGSMSEEDLKKFKD